MTDLASRVARVERLLARAIVAANSSAPVETHLGLACEFIGAREDFLSLLADRARMEKLIADLTNLATLAEDCASGGLPCARLTNMARAHTDAAMRHTLSVQATDKSDRAEGVAALQQAGEPVARKCRLVAGILRRDEACNALNDRAAAALEDAASAIDQLSSPLPQQTALVEQGGGSDA